VNMTLLMRGSQMLMVDGELPPLNVKHPLFLPVEIVCEQITGPYFRCGCTVKLRHLPSSEKQLSISPRCPGATSMPSCLHGNGIVPHGKAAHSSRTRACATTRSESVTHGPTPLWAPAMARSKNSDWQAYPHIAAVIMTRNQPNTTPIMQKTCRGLQWCSAHNETR
jgi:hypothetical protein